MPVRLFVGNLPYDATEQELREFFAAAGPLTHIHFPVDRETGRPRGFAFVEYAERSQAEEAIRKFNNQMFRGRMLAVNEARARGEAGPPPSRTGPPRPFTPRPSGSRPSLPRTTEWEPEPEEQAAARRARNFGPDSLPKSKRRYDKPERSPKAVPTEGRRGRTRNEFNLEEDFDDVDLDIDDPARKIDGDEDDEQA